MKLVSLAIGTVLLSVLIARTAGAYDCEASAASGAAADSITAPLPEDPETWLQADEIAHAQAESCVRFSPAPAPAPWKLPQLPALQKVGIATGGWIQQGITFNNYGSSNRFNGPLSTNDLNSQYQLNQLWLYLVRPTQTDGDGFDIGGRIDIVEGTDWRFGQGEGLENRINSSNNFYGLVLPQFYLEVAANNLTVKMGRFASQTSYEAVPAPLNFFYSHSHLMGGYFDPLLVTGLQADYKLCDHWTAVGGFNRGWLQFEDPTDTLNFLGGVRYTSDDKVATLSLLVDAGRQQGFTGVHDRNTAYLVYTNQLSKKLLYASQLNIGQEKNGSVVAPGDDADYYGLEQMLIRKLDDRWSLGLRYEWVCDEDGSRIAGIGNLLQSNKGWGGQPGFAGSFHELSAGINCRLSPNCVLRPEVRWDWYDGVRNVAGQYPFDNYARASQFTTAMDMVITY